jgi:acetyl-CoA acetyltransferase
VTQEVAVLGVGMHRFGKFPDVPFHVMAREAGFAALDDAGISFARVEASYVGHIGAGIMAHVKAMKEFGLTGLPVQHIENASATGSATFVEAYHAVRSGRYDVVMALGFEKMTEGRGMRDARDKIDALIVPAAFFAMWAQRRMHDRGTKPEHLAKIAAKNLNNASLNPYAQRRPKERVTVEDVLNAPMVADPLTAKMSCPVGDGAACVILGRADLATELQPGRPLVRVASSVLQSERYTAGHVFLGPVVGPHEMTRSVAREAYEKAGVGPEDVDVATVHDAFAIEELEYYELLGFAAPGDAEKLVDCGATELGGTVPFSTDGGLIGRGHPGGPTGLAQIWDITQQLRGEAGDRQVTGARVGLAHMVGAGSVAAMTILER